MHDLLTTPTFLTAHHPYDNYTVIHGAMQSILETAVIAYSIMVMHYRYYTTSETI